MRPARRVLRNPAYLSSLMSTVSSDTLHIWLMETQLLLGVSV